MVGTMAAESPEMMVVRILRWSLKPPLPGTHFQSRSIFSGEEPVIDGLSRL